MLTAALMAAGGAANASIIDIVDGVVDPGPARTSNNVFPNAYDGDLLTFTYTTESGTTVAPQHSRFDFEGDGHVLGRVRINDVFDNGGNGRMLEITVRYTTDTDADLNARTYQNVTSMVVTNDYPGDDATMPNVNVVGNSIEHLDTLHDGFYSITFDLVPGATGIEFEWNNDNIYKHWTIREIEAYAAAPSSRLGVIAIK